MIKTLVGVRLSAFSSSLMGKRSEKKPSVGKIILFALLYAYVAIVFLGLSVLMAITMGMALLPLGAGALYLAIFASATFAILFVMSIFETKSELFDCKDNELILSMPIKPKDIVIARILTVLIYNYLAALVIMLPAVIVYTVISGDAVGCLGAVLSMLIIPLPATALAGFFGYIVALISKRTKHSTLITVLFSLVFVFAYIILYSKMMTVSDEFFENLEGGLVFVGGAATVLGVIGNALLLSPLEFSIFAVASLLITVSSYILLSKKYMKIVTDNRGAARTAYKAEKMKAESAFLALLKKEFSKILSSSVYMLNAGLGTVFRVAIGVLALVKSTELINLVDLLILDVPGVSADGIYTLGVCLVILFMSSMDMFSASAVSLEGKSLWIIKSMPLKPYDVLLAKTAAHTLICSAASILSAALMLIALRASFVCWLIVLPFSVISALCFALFGTVINVALPKLEFENEAQPVKQSLACLVVMFGQMLYGVLHFFPSLIGAFAIGGFFTSLIILLLNVIICVVLYFIMSRVSVRKFANL